MAENATAPERLSYEGTIKTLLHTQRGAYDNLDYMPVFRASGVFYAIVDQDRTTVVSFMNYWLIKNDNDTVGTLVTLRDRDGQKLARSYFRLDHMVYQIDAQELLEQAGITLAAGERFEGTLELEFFSDQDFKFAFPALLVFYKSPTGISSVHTNQRIFNNREDLERGSRFNSWQTGFDVHCRNGARPFVYLINGERPANDAEARLVLFNAEGERMDRSVKLGDLPAFAARKLDLSDVNGVRDFLGDGIGFAKVDVDLIDVYCRFACGVEHDDDFIAVTHSYFDCNGFEDYYATDAFGPDIYPCFVPVNLVDGIEAEVVFYPIQSPSTMRLFIQAFDENGVERAWVEHDTLFQTDAGQQCRINPRAVLEKAGHAVGEEMVCIHLTSDSGSIPARITFGLNYHIGDKPGSNISSSVLLASSHGKKSRAWLWGGATVAPGGRNLAMVSHMACDKADRSRADYEVTVHNRDGEIARATGVIANGTGINVDIDALIAEQGYQATPGEFLWYVFKSDNPSMICNQIHISADGHIGGDHSF